MTIDDKTRELLLKVRKGATASFGTTHWQVVLPLMGFKFTVTEKERRTILAVEIEAPNGKTMKIYKEGAYRCILFYDFLRWVKAEEYNLSDMASKALGMETVAEENGRKEYKARDWTHTGTCGVCGGNVKMEDGGESTALVWHGYTRPGDGQQHGWCFGRGYEPHELSPKAADDFLHQVLIPKLESAKEGLANLKSGIVKRLTINLGDILRGQPAKYISEGEPGWEYRLLRAIEDQEMDVRHCQTMVDHFTAKVKDWKLEDLPEIKLAKLYGPK